ncbi:MAG: DUF2292 domain-containing protein [Candidatus Azambacteria bacterium]|nr:DUF2292 domain-containing protein [Candidatus Azambacteria bacterium]
MLLQILPEEIEIINDIRKLNFGKVTVVVQNGVIMSKEVTMITKNNGGKNNYNKPAFPDNHKPIA